MSLKHVMLGLLMLGDRHGYDLKRQYETRFPTAKPPAAAQIYATLDRLRRDGLVRQGMVDRAGGPDRTWYAATDEGRAELGRWLDDVEAPSPYVNAPLLTKVTLGLLLADETVARRFLSRQRAAHLHQMRELTRRKIDQASSLARVLAADYALDHLDADLRWIDTALARTKDLSKEMHR